MGVLLAVVPHAGRHMQGHNVGSGMHQSTIWHHTMQASGVQQAQCSGLLCRGAHSCAVQQSAVQESAMQGILVRPASYIERHAPDSLLL